MKSLSFILLTALAIISLSWFTRTDNSKASLKFKAADLNNACSAYIEKLGKKANAAKEFANSRNYNQQVCFFIDMSLPSGQSRFFIYDLKKDSVISKGPVAHGNCFQYWLEGRRYSNTVGSGCTSLGKYKVGTPYTGKFGYSYKLHGLDSSNSNALERTVVLHSHSCIPEKEVDDDICQSNGCPTVSPPMLDQLKTIINRSPRPLLLWIYE